MTNVILVASSGQRVGKSYLSKHLVNVGIAQDHKGFAIPIKRLAYALYYASGTDEKNKLTYSEFAQDKKDDPLFPTGLSPRDFVCDYSDYIQKFYGQDVWGKTAYDSLEKGSTTVFDDWRRYIESGYIASKGDVNILTIYLDREVSPSDTVEVVSSIPSSSSASYEGQIDPEKCDIYFKYTHDYSNFDELINLISQRIGNFKSND